MAQAIDKELNEYILMLNTSEKRSLVEIIKSYILPAKKEERISREQYNIEIMEAVTRVKAGHYITQEEVEKDAETW